MTPGTRTLHLIIWGTITLTTLTMITTTVGSR